MPGFSGNVPDFMVLFVMSHGPIDKQGVIKLTRLSIEACDGSPVAYVISSSIIVGYHKRLWPLSVTDREKEMKAYENKSKNIILLILLTSKRVSY